MIELNRKPRRAVARGEPVRIVDPLTHDSYVLVRAEVYARRFALRPITVEIFAPVLEGPSRESPSRLPREGVAMRGHRSPERHAAHRLRAIIC